MVKVVINLCILRRWQQPHVGCWSVSAQSAWQPSPLLSQAIGLLCLLYECMLGRDAGQCPKKDEPPALGKRLHRWGPPALGKRLPRWAPSASATYRPLEVEKEGLPWSLNLESSYTWKPLWEWQYER